MNRSGFFSALCVFSLSFATTALGADDNDAGGSPAEERPALKSVADVQVIPVFSMTQDIRSVLRFNEAMQEREKRRPNVAKSIGSRLLFAIVTEYLEVVPEPAGVFRFDAAMTRPAIDYYGDLVLPFSPELLKELKSDENIKQLEPNVFESNGTVVFVSERHYAASYGEDIAHTPEDIVRIRRLLQETEANPPQNTAAITVTPQKIGRSALKAELAGVRAQLQAEAQQRDDEDEVESLTRGLWQRLQISAFDAFFNDTEQLRFSMDYDESGQALVVELDVKCAKKSVLDEYIGKVAATRSRVLSYLHPDQVGFVSATIPLSEEIATPLPRIAALLAAELTGDAEGLAGSLPASMESTLQKITDDRRVECLIQTVPTGDDSTASVIILPLEYASTLQAPLIQLVSSSTGELNTIGEIDGFPVSEISELSQSLKSFGMTGDPKAMFVTTDQCIAVMLGTEDDIPLLETILHQDFEAPAAAATRFQRSVFAAEANMASLSALDHSLLGNSLMLAKPNDKDDDSPEPAGKLVFYVHTAPQRLTLTARFEGDTMISGIILLDSSVELLMGLYEYLLED